MPVEVSQPATIDKLIPLARGAKQYGLSVWTLRQWSSRKKITTVKIGGKVFIPQSEFDRLIVEGTRLRIGSEPRSAA